MVFDKIFAKTITFCVISIFLSIAGEIIAGYATACKIYIFLSYAIYIMVSNNKSTILQFKQSKHAQVYQTEARVRYLCCVHCKQIGVDLIYIGTKINIPHALRTYTCRSVYFSTIQF